MRDRHSNLERELHRIAAALEFLNPRAGTVLVIATVQGRRARQGYIATLLLDYGSRVRLTGRVMRQAYVLLWMRGYRVRFHPGEPLTHTVAGHSMLLSSHERLDIPNKFVRR